MSLARLLPTAWFLVELRLARAHDYDGCTSIVVGKGATLDGSALTSHANDCSTCDWRVVYVPAKDHPPGSRRVLLDSLWDQYPRVVDPERSAQYQADEGIKESVVLGSIPQVPHTYASWEGSYGLMNEHGLGLGESTCSALLVGNGTKDGGTAIFSIGNLMAIALERCKTARCAIQLMGDLASQYGFYGEDPGIGGAGEAVTLVDRSGEAWVFHITGGLPEYKGAKWEGQRGSVWAAQRVPDNHVAVIANSLIIRVIDPDDKENFMMHPGIFDLTHEAGLWSGEGPFDFQVVLQPDLATFSYFPGSAPIPMYSTLRMWGVYRKSSPSHKFAASTDLAQFPFSVPVEKKVSLVEVMDWFRDHYEGTEFDMTVGALAGPWGSPNRPEGGIGQMEVPGQFARAISIPRTSYTVLMQSGDVPESTVWYAPDASSSSVFVPFFSSALREGGGGSFAVESYGTGSMKSFSFTGGTAPAWWAFDFVANWMDLSYHNMSLTYVYPKVESLQREVVEQASKAVEAAAKAPSESARAKALATAHTDLQRRVSREWWDFAGMLVVRYNDKFFNWGENLPQGIATIGYPSFWLQQLGYDQESYRPTWLQRSETPPAALPEEVRQACKLGAAPAATTAAPHLTPAPAAPGSSPSVLTSGAMLSWACFVSAVMGLFAGNVVGYRRGQRDASADHDDKYRHMAA